MNYQTVLFDFDGTLTPSIPLWLKAYQRGLAALGVHLSDAEVMERCFYRKWEHVAQAYRLHSAEALVREVHRALHTAFLEARLFPSVPALLHACRAQGLRTAIVTTAPRMLLETVLPRLEVHEHFDTIVCADDVTRHKPDPEPVLTALERLQAPAETAIMVGDSTVDVVAGKAAGAATALFIAPEGSLLHSLEALHASAPDHIFSDHRELAQVLGLPPI